MFAFCLTKSFHVLADFLSCSFSVEQPRRKSRAPSNPAIPASIPISPGPSLLSLEEAQARSKGKGDETLRRGSVDFNQLQCKSNKENFVDLTPKKRSWKGLFSRNKSVSNDLDSYGVEKKPLSIAPFKRRVSYDVGSGLSTPRSQSSFNLRDLEPSELGHRQPVGKKGRKKKIEISSPLGIRSSSFVSYVGGMNQLERTNTAPEIELRQAAKAARAKNAARKIDALSTDRNQRESNVSEIAEEEFKVKLEVINDVSIEDSGTSEAPDNAASVPSQEADPENARREVSNSESQDGKVSFKELNQLIVNCSTRRVDAVANQISPVDEKSLRNSMWIEKYDEIAKSCSSSTTPCNEDDGKPIKEKTDSVDKTLPPSSTCSRSNAGISPRRRAATEIRDSILSRGSRELLSNSKYTRSVSESSAPRSQSVDLPCAKPEFVKRASCFSDSGVPSSLSATDGVLVVDWVPVMQRSLTNVNERTECVPAKHPPVQNCKATGGNEEGSLPFKHWTSRPFSSYDNHPLPQKGTSVIETDQKAKNRPSIYDNLLLVD